MEPKNHILVSREVAWLKFMYYENVLSEPNITTGITNKYREIDDTNGPYAGNYKSVG